jgi:hypothetical protein
VGPSPRDPYRQIWEDETGTESSDTHEHFTDHRETFLSIPGIMTETDPAERLDLWADYVRYMVVGVGDGRRDDVVANPFWGRVGISPRRFDWQDWRAAMGYSRRAK